MCISWMRWIDHDGTTKANSHRSGRWPPSRPAKPMVRRPRLRATASARLTFAEAPDVEMAEQRVDRTREQLDLIGEDARKIGVVADGGEERDVVGQRHRRQRAPLLDDRVLELDGDVLRVARRAAVADAHEPPAARRSARRARARSARSWRAWALEEARARARRSRAPCAESRLSRGTATAVLVVGGAGALGRHHGGAERRLGRALRGRTRGSPTGA